MTQHQDAVEPAESPYYHRVRTAWPRSTVNAVTAQHVHAVRPLHREGHAQEDCGARRMAGGVDRLGAQRLQHGGERGAHSGDRGAAPARRRGEAVAGQVRRDQPEMRRQQRPDRPPAMRCRAGAVRGSTSSSRASVAEPAATQKRRRRRCAKRRLRLALWPLKSQHRQPEREAAKNEREAL